MIFLSYNCLYNKKYLFNIVLYLLITPSLLNCSHNYIQSLQSVNKIDNIKKGDFILIELKDKTKIEGVFVKRKNLSIILETFQDTVSTQIAVRTDSIKNIQKYSFTKQSRYNTLITAGLISFIIFFFFGILKLRPGMGGAGV